MPMTSTISVSPAPVASITKGPKLLGIELGPFPFPAGREQPWFDFSRKPAAAAAENGTLPLVDARTYPRKRARPLADIDGMDGEAQTFVKKRRIRLALVSSRLSPPFAIPVTTNADSDRSTPTSSIPGLHNNNAVGSSNGHPKVSFWQRTRLVAKYVMRKAAILNKIRLDALAARAAQERQVEIAREQFRERIAAAASRSHESGSQYGGYRLRSRRKRKDGQEKKQKSKGSKSKYSCPPDRRPPSPPSEAELESQRLQLGLGIRVV